MAFMELEGQYQQRNEDGIIKWFNENENGKMTEKQLTEQLTEYLQRATKNNLPKVVEYLLKKEASPNGSAKPKTDCPLTIAKNEEIQKLLLQNGASLAGKSKNGKFACELLDAKILEEHFDSCVTLSYEDIWKYDDHSPKEPYVTYTYDCKNFLRPLGNSNGPTLETDINIVKHLSESPDRQHLLVHPLITCFLFMKWYHISYRFNINLAFYISFCLSLVLHVASQFHNDPKYRTTSKIILCMFLGLLSLREFLQLKRKPTLYLCNFKNLAVIVLIVTTLFIVTAPPRDEVYTNRSLYSTAILVAAFELILLIGQHPFLAESMFMLQTVLTNFFHFFFMNVIIIAAFAYTFFILFGEDFGHTIIKTSVMLTGEYEADKLKFDDNGIPLVGRTIFLLFIFLGTIVLLNLLNALAVSDTQEIRNKAQLVIQLSRTKQIGYYENLFFCDNNFFPYVWKDSLIRICVTSECCHIIGKPEREGQELSYRKIRFDSFTVSETKNLLIRNRFANDLCDYNDLLKRVQLQDDCLKCIKTEFDNLKRNTA